MSWPTALFAKTLTEHKMIERAAPFCLFVCFSSIAFRFAAQSQFRPPSSLRTGARELIGFKLLAWIVLLPNVTASGDLLILGSGSWRERPN